MGRRSRVRIGLVEILDLVTPLRDCNECELAEALTDEACEFYALIGVQQDSPAGVVCVPDTDRFVALLLRGADALRHDGEVLMNAELAAVGAHCARMASALGVASVVGLGHGVRVEPGLDGIPVLVVGGRRG